MARRDSGFSLGADPKAATLGFDWQFSHWELRCRRETAAGARHNEGRVPHFGIQPFFGDSLCLEADRGQRGERGHLSRGAPHFSSQQALGQAMGQGPFPGQCVPGRAGRETSQPLGAGSN